MSDVSFPKNLLGLSEKSLAKFQSRFTVDETRDTAKELGPCWVWTGADSHGYGSVSMRKVQEAHLQTHRLAYRLEIGPIPPHCRIRRTCRNVRCGRPDHLWAETSRGDSVKPSDRPSFSKNLLGLLPDVLAKFESRFRLDFTRPALATMGPCWAWGGGLAGGYGRVFITAVRASQIPTHCLAYRLEVGPIPPRHDVHHKCENKLCGNPSHLEALTRKQHWAATPRHNGNVTHCPHGHLYDEANIYYTKGKVRVCRECLRIRSKLATAAMREVVPAVPIPIATHCPKGHEYGPDNTQYWKGERRCRRCKADWTLQKYYENREANMAAKRAHWAANADAINAARRLKVAQANELRRQQSNVY